MLGNHGQPLTPAALDHLARRWFARAGVPLPVGSQGPWHLLRRRTAAASVRHPVSLTQRSQSRSNDGAPTATPVDRRRLLLGGADER